MSVLGGVIRGYATLSGFPKANFHYAILKV